MSMCKTCVLPVLAVLLSVVGQLSSVSAQTIKERWAPHEMFDPVTQARDCGFSSDEAAYVCDPNGILGKDLGSFNWILKDAAYNSTRCPCSNFYCENRSGAKGYRIGLALVRQMTLEKGSDGKMNTPRDQAQLFAYHLESKHWNLGNCEEDIIIFYSLVDQVLAIYGGQTAAIKLTPYKRQLLAYRVGPHLEEGRVVEALNNLLFDLKILLNCDDDSSNNVDCGLHEVRSSAVPTVSTATALLMLLPLALYNSFL